MPGCAECGRTSPPPRAYEAHDVEHRRACVVRLCELCLRERGAAWRWRWRIEGRELPGRKAA